MFPTHIKTYSTTTTTTATTNITLHYTTPHYIQQLWVRWPLKPLHKAQPPFVAIHASQQLTSPIVSYLGDFRDRLVPYYWYCFFKLFWQIWEKESQKHPTCLSFHNFNFGHHHRPRLLGVSNFEQNPRCPPWFSERNLSPAAGRFHDPHRDLAVGTEGLCFGWPADVHATCSPMTSGRPEFQRTLVPDWKRMARSSHGDKWEKTRSSQSTGWQSRNMAKYAGVQIFVHSPTSIDKTLRLVRLGQRHLLLRLAVHRTSPILWQHSVPKATRFVVEAEYL